MRIKIIDRNPDAIIENGKTNETETEKIVCIN